MRHLGIIRGELQSLAWPLSSYCMLIIDTYNVLHTTGVLPPDLAIGEVNELIELMARSRYRAIRAILVCDGTPPPPGPPPSGPPSEPPAPGTKPFSSVVSVRYSGPHATADDLIAALIRRSSTPRRLVVVSSDHAVQREGKRRRCVVLGSELFLDQLSRDAGAGSRVSNPEPSQSSSLAAHGKFLPRDIVSEAEALIEAHAVAEEKAQAEASMRLAREEDARQSAEHARRAEETAAAERAREAEAERARELSSILPQDLIAQAERLAVSSLRQVELNEAPPAPNPAPNEDVENKETDQPASRHVRDAQSSLDRFAAELDDAHPAVEPVIPESILAEADRIWRDALPESDSPSNLK